MRRRLLAFVRYTKEWHRPPHLCAHLWQLEPAFTNRFLADAGALTPYFIDGLEAVVRLNRFFERLIGTVVAVAAVHCTASSSN
jgi:hypothetical protein